MEPAMLLTNSPFELDQAGLLVESQEQDSGKRKIPKHQRGTARSGHDIWFSIPLESGGRTLPS